MVGRTARQLYELYLPSIPYSLVKPLYVYVMWIVYTANSVFIICPLLYPFLGNRKFGESKR